LYAKQHRVTGLRYFGKTTRDPQKYIGSGVYWRKHLECHGKQVDTVWTKEFDSIDECKEFAIAFSEIFDIVESNDWANLKPENGLDGWPAGTPNPRTVPQSAETRAKKSASLKGHPGNVGEKNGRYGISMSEETKQKMRATKAANPTAIPWTAERRAKVAATWAKKKEQV
jgi:hypothetical protein